MRESGMMINEAQHLLSKELNKKLANSPAEAGSLKSDIIDILSPYLYDQTKRRPMVLPVVMEV